MTPETWLVVGTTQGDDLIPPREAVVACCLTREEAEQSLARILEERSAWLGRWADAVPWWQQCMLYAGFEIRRRAHAG